MHGALVSGVSKAFSVSAVCFVLREACTGQPLGSDVCSALREQPSAWCQGPSCEWDPGGPCSLRPEVIIPAPLRGSLSALCGAGEETSAGRSRSCVAVQLELRVTMGDPWRSEGNVQDCH